VLIVRPLLVGLWQQILHVLLQLGSTPTEGLAVLRCCCWWWWQRCQAWQGAGGAGAGGRGGNVVGACCDGCVGVWCVGSQAFVQLCCLGRAMNGHCNNHGPMLLPICVDVCVGGVNAPGVWCVVCG